MEDNMREFVALSRKVLREYLRLEMLLNGQKYDEAKTLIDEMIEDIRKDIEV